MTDSQSATYDSRDIRFTTNNGNLNAIFLARPEAISVMRSLAEGSVYKVREILQR